MLHYLPGCDVRKKHPQAIEKLTNYMKNQGALIDTCCRNKEDFLKENDVLVQNCTFNTRKISSSDMFKYV